MNFYFITPVFSFLNVKYMCLGSVGARHIKKLREAEKKKDFPPYLSSLVDIRLSNWFTSTAPH